MLSQLFFAALRAWFDKENIRCPINRVSQPGNEDDWLVLSLDHSLMGKPSYECMSVAQQGYYSLNGEKLHPGVFHGDGVRPEFFFHGTDMEALCLILISGHHHVQWRIRAKTAHPRWCLQLWAATAVRGILLCFPRRCANRFREPRVRYDNVQLC